MTDIEIPKIIFQLNRFLIGCGRNKPKCVRLDVDRYSKFDNYMREWSKWFYGVDTVFESEFGIVRKFQGVPVILK